MNNYMYVKYQKSTAHDAGAKLCARWSEGMDNASDVLARSEGAMERKVFGTKWDISPDLSTNSPDFPGPKGLFRGALGCFWDAVGTNWDKVRHFGTFWGHFPAGPTREGMGIREGNQLNGATAWPSRGMICDGGASGPYIKVMPGRSGCQRRGVSGAGFHFRWRRSTATGAWIPACAGKTGEKGGRELRRPPREDHPDWKAAVSVVEPARMESASAREWRNEAVYRNLRQPALLPPATR